MAGIEHTQGGRRWRRERAAQQHAAAGAFVADQGVAEAADLGVGFGALRTDLVRIEQRELGQRPGTQLFQAWEHDGHVRVGPTHIAPGVEEALVDLIERRDGETGVQAAVAQVGAEVRHQRLDRHAGGQRH